MSLNPKRSRLLTLLIVLFSLVSKIQVAIADTTDTTDQEVFVCEYRPDYDFSTIDLDTVNPICDMWCNEYTNIATYDVFFDWLNGC